jgi:hypothetical protein
MITGVHEAKDPTLAGLFSLEKLAGDFELSGSRRFGNFTKSSDWDFATNDGPEMRESLMSVGFTQREMDYSDCNTNGVMERGHIQVILCVSLERRQTLFGHLESNGGIPSKIQPEEWDALYAEHAPL